MSAMPAMRIDNFTGSDEAYAGYLYQITKGCPLAECIRYLEEQVTVKRRGKPQLAIEFWSIPSPRRPPEVWKKLTARFFAQLAKTEEQWQKKRTTVGLSSADDVLRATDLLVFRGNEIHFTDHAAKLTPEAALTTFAQNTGSFLAQQQTFSIIAPFLSLIFLAACEVALFKGVQKKDVRAVQREFLKESRGDCNVEDSSLDKDRGAARWLINQMQRQFQRGLRHRAFEVFLLEGRGLHFYRDDCPKDDHSHDEFTALVPCWDVPAEIQASLPFWIPFLVGLNFSHYWSYREICEGLHVEVLNEEEDYSLYLKTYSSRKLISCQLLVASPPAQPTINKNGKKRKGLYRHSRQIQVQGPSHSNVEVHSPQDNRRSVQSSPGTALEQVVLGTRFTPVNPGANMTALQPNDETTQAQSRPDRETPSKRPRHGSNDTGHNRRTDSYPGIPPHALLSPPQSQPQSWPNDQAHTPNHSNANLFVDARDGADGTNLQETRMFTPINAGQDGGPTTSPPDNSSAASRSPRWGVMRLTPRSPSTARVHPSNSAAAAHDVWSSNNIQLHSEFTPQGAMASNEQVSTDVPSGQPGNWTGMGSIQVHFDSSGEAATVRSPDILLEAARVLDPAMLSAPTGQESRFWEPVVDSSASVGGSEGLARELVDTTADTSDNRQADEVRFMEFSDLVDWNCAGIETGNFMQYEI